MTTLKHFDLVFGLTNHPNLILNHKNPLYTTFAHYNSQGAKVKENKLRHAPKPLKYRDFSGIR